MILFSYLDSLPPLKREQKPGKRPVASGKKNVDGKITYSTIVDFLDLLGIRTFSSY